MGFVTIEFVWVDKFSPFSTRSVIINQNEGGTVINA